MNGVQLRILWSMVGQSIWTIRPYFSRRLEFAISDNCLIWTYRIGVPFNLRQKFLENSHLSHLGIVEMKRIGRSHFWWHGLSEHIEKLVKNVSTVQEILTIFPKFLWQDANGLSKYGKVYIWSFWDLLEISITWLFQMLIPNGLKFLNPHLLVLRW